MELSHDYRIDRLRLLACFGVVMLHSSYGTGIGDLALNAIFRFCVPVFVIISGYFLLSSRPSGIGIKILRIFLKMVLCSAAFLLFSLSRGNTLPEQPIVYLLTAPVHLWYLYATMGLYLLTPALVPFVRSADRNEYRYALTVCFVLGCCVFTLVRLEWFPLLSTILDKSKLPDMLGFTGLYLLGGYFKKFGIGNVRIWLGIFVICTGFSIGVCHTSHAQFLLGFLSPNVVLAGCACFAICMTLPDVPAHLRRPLRSTAECTMGVYLYHSITSNLVTKPYLKISQELLGGAVAMSARAVCTFSLTLLMVWLLRKISFLKKWML